MNTLANNEIIDIGKFMFQFNDSDPIEFCKLYNNTRPNIQLLLESSSEVRNPELSFTDGKNTFKMFIKMNE